MSGIVNPGDPYYAFFLFVEMQRVRYVVGYDPRFLLTDQRSPEKRIADALIERYRIAFPAISDFWAGVLDDIPRHTYMGEYIGRMSSKVIPAFLPQGEHVIPKSRKGEPVERTIVVRPGQQTILVQTIKFTPEQEAELREAMARRQDDFMKRAILGTMYRKG